MQEPIEVTPIIIEPVFPETNFYPQSEEEIIERRLDELDKIELPEEMFDVDKEQNWLISDSDKFCNSEESFNRKYRAKWTKQEE